MGAYRFIHCFRSVIQFEFLENLGIQMCRGFQSDSLDLAEFSVLLIEFIAIVDGGCMARYLISKLRNGLSGRLLSSLRR
jgi:hypothetical protein